MRRYHLNHYLLKLAFWALKRVHFETRSKRLDLIDVRADVARLGMMNAGILLRGKEAKA